jgi:hypothetical protein
LADYEIGEGMGLELWVVGCLRACVAHAICLWTNNNVNAIDLQVLQLIMYVCVCWSFVGYYMWFLAVGIYNANWWDVRCDKYDEFCRANCFADLMGGECWIYIHSELVI